MNLKKMKNKQIIFFGMTIGLLQIFCQKNQCIASEVIKVASKTSSAAHCDIAILNIDKLLHDSKAAKEIQTKLEDHRLKFQEEMKKHEENFIAVEKILVEQQENLKPEEFAVKRKEFDAKVAEVHQQATQKREQIERTFSQAMEKIQETILILVRDMAEKNGYKLVIPRNFIIFREDGLEITDEILKELDQKLPSVELKFY